MSLEPRAILIGCIGVTLIGVSVYAADDSASGRSSDKNCKVVERQTTGNTHAGGVSTSVTAGNGQVSAQSSGGHGVTVHSGNGSVGSSVATTGSGNGSTTVTTSDGNCIIYVNPGQKKDE